MNEFFEDITINNKKQTNILVYCLNYSIDNNRVLILSDKINKENVEHANFEFIYKTHLVDETDINTELNNIHYSFVFTERKLLNSKYVIRTFFNLSKNIIHFKPYMFHSPKTISDYHINTHLNLNMDHVYVIPDDVHNCTKSFNKSVLIWSPSWDNISNDHFLIRKINEIGYKYYKRKNNLIDVVASNDANKINKFSNCIENNSNICIYQESLNNPLKMKKCVYMNWFFDSLNDISNNDSEDLYLYQFPMYSYCSNIIRNKYQVPIDINCTNMYPNSLPLIFNVKNVVNYILNVSNDAKQKTIESCYLLRKTNDSHPLKMMDKVSDFFIHPENSINLDSYSLEENIGMFLKCKKFYCYDNVCFLPVLASLCDCTPVLINKYHGFENIKEIYKTYSPWMYYGIAYDDTEEELNFAKNTKNLLIDTINKIENDDFLNFFSDSSGDIQVINFLKYLECYFSVCFYE